MKNQYDMDELLELANHKQEELWGEADAEPISERTFRYWISQGLLQRTGSRGKSATYSENTVTRVLFIRKLQKMGRRSLAEIQVALAKVSNEEIALFVSGEKDLSRLPESIVSDAASRAGSREPAIGAYGKANRNRASERANRYLDPSKRGFRNRRDPDRWRNHRSGENTLLPEKPSTSLVTAETYDKLEKRGDTEIASILRSVEWTHREHVYELEASMREINRTIRETERALRESERALRDMEDRYAEVMSNEKFMSDVVSRLKDSQARFEFDLTRLEDTLHQQETKAKNGADTND